MGSINAQTKHSTRSLRIDLARKAPARQTHGDFRTRGCSPRGKARTLSLVPRRSGRDGPGALKEAHGIYNSLRRGAAADQASLQAVPCGVRLRGARKERDRVMQFQYRDGQELSMSIAGDPVWSYHFATDRHKPFLHPLRTPSGVPLTAFEPWDHQWHRGLWFSWQYINDVNYWEERADTPDGAGTVHFMGPEQVTLSPRGAEIRTHYELRDPSGLEVMESVLQLHFHIPKQDRYLIDWTLSWNAKTDLQIRRAAEEGDGYSGLALRTARTLGNLKLLNSEGQQDAATQDQPARWVDITGLSDGGWGLHAGACLMEHPENFRTPNAWMTRAQEGYGFVNPSLVMHEPIALLTGEGFTLNYRVLVHDGALGADELAEAFEDYVNA